MKPGSKEAIAAEAEASQAQSSKAKLSSAKPEEIKPDKAAAAAAAKAKLSTSKKSLTWSETYYARPSDIYECFVVDGKVRPSCNKIYIICMFILFFYTSEFDLVSWVSRDTMSNPAFSSYI